MMNPTMEGEPKLAAGSGTSIVVEACQACRDPDLQSVLFLGYLPPVNQMRPIGARPPRAARLSGGASLLSTLRTGADWPYR